MQVAHTNQMQVTHISSNTQTVGAKTTLTNVLNIVTTVNSITEKVIKARQSDKSEYKNIKNQLPAFLLHGTDGTGRTVKHITDYSGIVVVDFDGCETETDAIALKQVLCKSEYVIMCFISPSGRGVKCFIRTDNKDISLHKSVYKQVTEYIRNFLQSNNMNDGNIDESGSDASRICYYSYDNECYSNLQAKILCTNSIANDSSGTNKQEGLANERNVHCSSYELIERLLRFNGFDAKDGTGRHISIFKTCATVNRLGISIDSAENDLRDCLKSFGLDESYVDEKINKCLKACYKTYELQHNTRTLPKAHRDINIPNERRIQISKYLSEKPTNILEIINMNGNKLVQANTGTGKSTGFINVMVEHTEKKANDGLGLGEGEFMIFVTPNRDTAINIYEGTKAGLLAVGGEKWRKNYHNRKNNVIVCVADLYSDVRNYLHHQQHTVKCTIIDEIHKAESDCDFRLGTMTILSKLLSNESENVVAITATPTPYLDKAFDYVYKFDETHKQHINCGYEQWYDITKVVDDIKESIGNGRKCFVRVPSKVIGMYLTDTFGKDSVFLSADTKDLSEHKSITSEGKMPCSIVICTSIFEDGVSVKDDLAVDMFYIYEQNEILNPVRCRQFSARVRTNKETSIKVYFKPRKSIGDKGRNQLALENYICENLLAYANTNGITHDESIEGFGIGGASVNDTARKRLHRNGSKNILSVLNNCTKKHYLAFGDEFAGTLTHYFDTVTNIDSFILCVERAEGMKQQIKGIREHIKLNDALILEACSDEYVFEGLWGAYMADSPPLSINQTMDKHICRGTMAERGLGLDIIIRSSYKTILSRLDLIRSFGIKHERALDLLNENMDGNSWNILFRTLGEMKRLSGRELNNIPASIDKHMDLEMLANVFKCIQVGEEFNMRWLIGEMKERGLLGQWAELSTNTIIQKITAIIKVYTNHMYVKRKNERVWVVWFVHSYESIKEYIGGGDADSLYCNLQSLPPDECTDKHSTDFGALSAITAKLPQKEPERVLISKHIEEFWGIKFS